MRSEISLAAGVDRNQRFVQHREDGKFAEEEWRENYMLWDVESTTMEIRKICIECASNMEEKIYPTRTSFFISLLFKAWTLSIQVHLHSTSRNRQGKDRREAIGKKQSQHVVCCLQDSQFLTSPLSLVLLLSFLFSPLCSSFSLIFYTFFFALRDSLWPILTTTTVLTTIKMRYETWKCCKVTLDPSHIIFFVAKIPKQQKTSSQVTSGSRSHRARL